MWAQTQHFTGSARNKALYISLALLGGVSCGGGSSGPTTPPAPGPGPVIVDEYANVAEQSPFWDQAVRGIRLNTFFDAQSDPTVFALASIDYPPSFSSGINETRRIYLLEGTGKLISYQIGTAPLEIDLAEDDLLIELGTITAPLSEGCQVYIQRALEVDTTLPTQVLHWIEHETVQFEPVGANPDCTDILLNFATTWLEGSDPTYPYSPGSLIDLNAIASVDFADLVSWEFEYKQTIAKYYRTLGDAGFELAGPVQAFDVNSIGNLQERADWLRALLTE